jgi:Right handed beta helix region
MSNYFRVPTTALFLLATLTATSLAGTATTASDLPATSVPPTGNWRIISGLNIQGDYSLSGHAYDGVLLINSNITGSLRIDDVDHLYLLGNTIGSIWMPGLYATTNVTIDSNEISQGLNDCIHIHDGGVYPTNLLIENNNIHDCGVAHPGSTLYHAIYDQVPDVVIQGNHIWNANAAISIRSSGVVTGNLIEQVPFSGGIEYYSDHDAPVGSTLTLQGNTVRTLLNNSADAWGSRRGLIVLGNGIGTTHRPVSSFIVDSNVLVVLNPAVDASGIYYDIYTQTSLPNARLTHNTLVNLIPTGLYMGPSAVGSETDTQSHALPSQ